MSQTEIMAAIPHRPPMLLVDQIVQREADRIVCRKTFAVDEFFVQGHYPHQPIVPGVVLCEAAMQSGAVLLSFLIADVAGRVPVATRMNNVKFRNLVRPGDTVECDVQLVERLADAFFLNAVVRSEGRVAVRLEFACTLTEVD